MKHKIIQTENYLLIVDDSQITEGDLEVPKSFINSQGLTQWVSRYIF
jgi:hypothetical protein